MIRPTIWRLSAIALLAPSLLLARTGLTSAASEHAATPPAASCESLATPTGAMNQSSGHDMPMVSPASAQEIDLLYIDMMIPHHESIIALAQAALPRLQDERLRTMAQAIVDTQTTEIEELEGYRLAFYGSADPQPIDKQGMMVLMGDMTHPMDAAMMEMNTEAQLAAFCAAADPDLAFIHLTIPHHESAVMTSQVVVAEAVHPEIRAIAQRVIDAQQREIEQLQQIRLELTGQATPAA